MSATLHTKSAGGTFAIWRRYHSGGEWAKTSHTVKARTADEAQARMRRRFQGAGFSSMSLIALPEGQQP